MKIGGKRWVRVHETPGLQRRTEGRWRLMKKEKRDANCGYVWLVWWRHHYRYNIYYILWYYLTLSFSLRVALPFFWLDTRFNSHTTASIIIIVYLSTHLFVSCPVDTLIFHFVLFRLSYSTQSNEKDIIFLNNIFQKVIAQSTTAVSGGDRFSHRICSFVL